MRRNTPTTPVRPWRDATLAGLGHLTSALIGIVGLWHVSHLHLRAEMREALTNVATAAAAVVDGDLHRTLTSRTQMDGQDYKRCIAPLRSIYATVKGVKFIYTVVLDGDQVRFVLDTAAAGDNDGDGVEDRSELWSKYDDADEAMLTALHENRPLVDSDPRTDKWGSFVSAYAPIHDSAGRTVGIVGVDMAAADYLSHLAAARRWALLGLLPALALSLSAAVVTYKLTSRARRDSHVQQAQAEELAAYRDRLEAAVHERTSKLLEAERQVLQGEKLASIGRLAAGVAHEINTPIQYVGDNLRALADFHANLQAVVAQYRELVRVAAEAGAFSDIRAAIEDAEREHDLEFVLEDAPKAASQGLDGVQRVAKIVRAMKDFSHVSGGQAAPVDLNDALRNTLTVARNEYKYYADVETDFATLPEVVCFAGELNQVFLNLLVNAAHAIQDTGRRGTIRIATRARDGGVEISVSDNGVGIPEQIRQKIYEPFFTTKEVGRGTGQGLSIAHRIVVEMHKGELACESEVGVGTTFHIRLPLRPVVATNAEAPANTANTPPFSAVSECVASGARS